MSYITPKDVGLSTAIVNSVFTYDLSLGSGKNRKVSGILAIGIGIVSGGLAYGLARKLTKKKESKYSCYQIK